MRSCDFTTLSTRYPASLFLIKKHVPTFDSDFALQNHVVRFPQQVCVKLRPT